MRCVLDLGCGQRPSSAAELKLAAREWDVRRSRRDSEMVEIAINLELLRNERRSAPELGFVCACGQRLPFQSEAFDFVVSFTWLKEISRLLRRSEEC
jgi:ubiquinone/menaquinone biosynthesis C-methylase UbiE